MHKIFKRTLLIVPALFLTALSLWAKPAKGSGAEWTDDSVPSFYETYKDQFDYVGLCAEYGNFGLRRLGADKYTASYEHDKNWGEPKEIYFPEIREGIKKHVNTLTTGNELKPQFLLAWWNRGDGAKQQMVDFKASNGLTIKVPSKLNNENLIYAVLNSCKEMGIKMRGHVLTWHSQTPDDFFAVGYKAVESNGVLKNPVDKETMTARHEWYVKTVLECVAKWEKANGYGEGNHIIWAWDVVNEACADDVTKKDWLRGATVATKNKSSDVYPQGSRWYQIYESEEFILNAFRFANAYAPEDVLLCYNDYNEYVSAKTDAICSLISLIQNGEAKTVNGKSVKPRIDVMGMQSHVGTSYPGAAAYETAVKRFLAMGLDIHVTELDFSAATQSAAAKAYADYFKVMQKYGKSYAGSNKITCVTIWGLANENSWINPSNGKTTYPLLFTKKADKYFTNDSFDAVIEAHN